MSEEHITDALDRTVSRMNSASFRALLEQRNVQFLSLEIMKGNLRQRDPASQARYKRELQNCLMTAKVISDENFKLNPNLLNDKEHLRIPCVTDLNLRDEEGRTVVSQYLSPPRCLRLIESEAAEDLRDDIERGLSEEEIGNRFLNGRDEPIAPHVMVPARTPSDGIDPAHPMRRDMAMVEPLILCPGRRTPQSVEHYIEKYPCSCWAREVLKQAQLTLIVCWDLSEILVLGLPGPQSQVVVLPMSSLLAVQWMMQNPEDFHHGRLATPEQIGRLGKLDLTLFEAFARLMDLPGWLRVHLGRRQFEPEIRTYMLQILYKMAVIAADLVEEAAALFTCEITFKELSLVSAVYRNAKIGTVNHRWPARKYEDPEGHNDDNLTLVISQMLHEKCAVGAVPLEPETIEGDANGTED